MDRLEEKLLTPDQLCDALEVHLGHTRGKKACRDLLEKLKGDPEWRAQLNSLSCTVQVFQRVGGIEVPQDVHYRLMTVLNLGENEEDCSDNTAK